MKWLLDTHAALWLALGSRKLGAKARRKLQTAASSELALSDISLYELASLDARGRIKLADGFLRELAAHVTLLSIEPDIAAVAARLALPQGDPFDRMIVATALHHELTLVTADLAITESRLVPVLW